MITAEEELRNCTAFDKRWRVGTQRPSPHVCGLIIGYDRPQAWLADVLVHIDGHPAQQLDDLLPWNLATAKAKRVDRVA